MYRIARFALPLLAVGLLMWGCSGDDDDNPAGPGGNNGGTITDAPDVSALTVPIPLAMQTAANSGSNPGAASAVAYISAANSIAAFASYFTLPSGAPALIDSRMPNPMALAPQDSVTWTDGQLTITVVTRQIEGSVITYEVRLDGSDGQGTYNNFPLVEGYFFPDGSEGEFNLYSTAYGPSQPISSWNWVTAPGGARTITYSVWTTSQDIVVTHNPTGSGAVSFTANGATLFTANWAANGTGSYITYDSNGGIIDSGSW